MPELNDHVANRVAGRVRVMEGLQRCGTTQVRAVHEGRNIADPFMQAVIRRELEEYGFPPQPPKGGQK